MHNDFGSSTKREGWIFGYRGKELLPYAEAAFKAHLKAEMAARGSMSKMITDPKFSQRDPELERLKREIENNGKIREQCAVWVNQFAREPDREFHLALGDITFFGIVREPTEMQIDEATGRSKKGYGPVAHILKDDDHLPAIP